MGGSTYFQLWRLGPGQGIKKIIKANVAHNHSTPQAKKLENVINIRHFCIKDRTKVPCLIVIKSPRSARIFPYF